VDPRPSEHFGGSDIRFGQLTHGATILDRSLHQGYGIGFPTRDPPPDTVSGRDIAHICVPAFTMVVLTVARLQFRAKLLCALSHALGAREVLDPGGRVSVFFRCSTPPGTLDT
jgi:hypothetical protein